MRSASSGSADRNAICVTFSLSRENAVELQNMAHTCAGQLRELGVLAVQVGNTTAVSLQPRVGNACQSVHHGGTLDHRQQSLNATRTNIAQYLGANISSFPPVVGNSSAAENNMQNNCIHHPNAVAIASMSPGVTVNAAAESSPHIVNLLQHDVVSSRSVCLSMPTSSASDVRPRKRARRRTPSAAAEVLVPLSMFGGTADCANSVYSFHQPSRCVDSSSVVPPVYNMPEEQFKVPESRRRKACSSRKAAAAKSQLMPVTEQAQSHNLTNLFSTGFSDCTKSGEVGMFDPTTSYAMGDGFQMNGVNPYNRIPVMTAGWQIHPVRAVPSKSLYRSIPAAAQYPNEYGHPQFRFPGNIDYSQVTANANKMPGVAGVETYHSFTPGSSVVLVSDANQKFMKEQVLSVFPKQTSRWTSASESQSGSVPYGINSGSPMPSVHGLHNTTDDESGGLPMSHIMQRQFVASQSDALAMSAGSKPCTETVSLASEKMVHLSISSDIHRIKNIPVCDAPNINSLSGGCVNMPPSRVNGLFADIPVHSSALAVHRHTEHVTHVKLNGDVDCLQHADNQALTECETVFDKSSAVTVSPYAPPISSVPTSIGDTNCVLERQLQQFSTQLPVKVQQCSLASFEDTGLNGCSDNTMPDVPKLSMLSGMFIHHGLDVVYNLLSCYSVKISLS